MAAHESAWHISDNSDGPLTLMVSGGVDSQAMAYAFKTAGVPFTAVMARYGDFVNDHDFDDTAEFYQRHGIPVEFIDLDILRFHHEELFFWADRYINTSPHFLSHCKIASMLPGTVVSSGFIINARYKTTHMNYSAWGLARYGEISGKPVVPFFFSYSPEMIAASDKLSLGSVLDRDNSYRDKCKLYWESGFPVIPQKDKTHGFEIIKRYFDTVPVSTATRLLFKGRPSKRPYDLMFRYPLEARHPYSNFVQTIL